MSPLAPEIVTLGSPHSVLRWIQVGFERGLTRVLTLHGLPAYKLGHGCDTCEFLFERLEGSTRDSVTEESLARDLAAGVPTLDAAWLRSVGQLLPVDEYVPFYMQPTLRLVTPGKGGDYFTEEQVATWGVNGFWGLPHHPRTEYYRGRVVPLAPTYGNRAVFEFVVPMFPHGWLDADRVAEYRARAASEPPTALALSVLDVKGPAVWDKEPAVAQHWCLAHFLLDGHHKVYAAAAAGAPVGLLSFLAVGQSIATSEEALEAVRHVTAPATP